VCVGSVWVWTATHCTTLQHTATHSYSYELAFCCCPSGSVCVDCNIMQHTATHCNALQFIMLQCVAVCCSVLQCVAVCCSVQFIYIHTNWSSLVACPVVCVRTVTRCNTLQHTATHSYSYELAFCCRPSGSVCVWAATHMNMYSP